MANHGEIGTEYRALYAMEQFGAPGYKGGAGVQ
jgi:hypothetical protein